MDWGSRKEPFGISLGCRSLIWGCQLSGYWFLRGLASLHHCPLFCISIHFLGSLAEIFWIIFHQMVRTSTSEAISVFLLVQLDLIAKWIIYPTNWSAPPIPLKVSGSSSSEHSTSPASSAFAPDSSAIPLLSTVADWVVKVQLPFNFQKGNKFPLCWRMSYVWSPIWSHFQVRVSHRMFTIHIMGQHPLVFEVQSLIVVIPLHLLYVLLLDPSQILQLEYLDFLQQVHSKLSHILLWSLCKMSLTFYNAHPVSGGCQSE